jgi:hypothetical protein
MGLICFCCIKVFFSDCRTVISPKPVWQTNESPPEICPEVLPAQATFARAVLA